MKQHKKIKAFWLHAASRSSILHCHYVNQINAVMIIRGGD